MGNKPFNNGKNIAVVIQCQKEKEVLARLSKEAPSLFGLGRYAYILHDKDLNEQGDLKGPHIHIVLCADVGKSSANWIEHFSDGLKVEKSAVSVQMQGSEKKCIRYLLHLDDGAKHQYDRSEVVTNMDATCKKWWDAPSGFVTNPTFEQLEEAYKQGKRALYNLVGMTGYNKAKNTIEDIISAENEAERAYRQVKDLRDVLCEFTANPRYLEKGYIPFQDFQAALFAVDGTLEEMTKEREAMQRLKEKTNENKKH